MTSHSDVHVQLNDYLNLPTCQLVLLIIYIASLSLLFTGWIDHLVSYETERQRHNVTSTAGIDSLYRLYSTQFTPLVLARSLGLATVNALNPIKVCIQLTGYTVNICHTSLSSNLEGNQEFRPFCTIGHT